MQREDKQLELVLENFQTKLNEFKAQIYALIFKLEHERDNVNWTTVLDTFAVFSTQYTAIAKYLSYEKLPQLRNYSVLPLMLNPERDEELARITENRVPALSHDIVPDFLRTKTEPEVEHKLMQVRPHDRGSCLYYVLVPCFSADHSDTFCVRDCSAGRAQGRRSAVRNGAKAAGRV